MGGGGGGTTKKLIQITVANGCDIFLLTLSCFISSLFFAFPKSVFTKYTVYNFICFKWEAVSVTFN